MFEDFSFSSPPQGELSTPGGDGALVSPLSSRCPSPVPPVCSRSPRPSLLKRASHYKGQAGPTSIPPDYTDTGSLSISQITRRLNAQSLDSNSSCDSYDGASLPITPRSGSDTLPMWWDVDPLLSPASPRQKSDTPSPTPTPQIKPARPTFNPSYWEGRPMWANEPTCSCSEEPYRREEYMDLRERRQGLSMLQCTTSNIPDTLRLAFLVDQQNNSLDDGDRHPSSLPLPRRSFCRRSSALHFSPDFGQRSRLFGASSGRVEKARSPSAARCRKTRTGHGLRRRSLVLAAVTAVVDANQEKSPVDLDDSDDELLMDYTCNPLQLPLLEDPRSPSFSSIRTD